MTASSRRCRRRDQSVGRAIVDRAMMRERRSSTSGGHLVVLGAPRTSLLWHSTLMLKSAITVRAPGHITNTVEARELKLALARCAHIAPGCFAHPCIDISIVYNLALERTQIRELDSADTASSEDGERRSSDMLRDRDPLCEHRMMPARAGWVVAIAGLLSTPCLAWVGPASSVGLLARKVRHP